jgi:hypothetical protein
VTRKLSGVGALGITHILALNETVDSRKTARIGDWSLHIGYLLLKEVRVFGCSNIQYPISNIQWFFLAEIGPQRS